MNKYIAGIKKDLVPRLIVNGHQIYIGFVHGKAKNPIRFYDFLENGCFLEEMTPKLPMDFIYPLSLSSYFQLNDKIMIAKNKYNLMKKKHQYNTEKYGKKTSSKSNTM